MRSPADRRLAVLPDAEQRSHRLGGRHRSRFYQLARRQLPERSHDSLRSLLDEQRFRLLVELHRRALSKPLRPYRLSHQQRRRPEVDLEERDPQYRNAGGCHGQLQQRRWVPRCCAPTAGSVRAAAAVQLGVPSVELPAWCQSTVRTASSRRACFRSGKVSVRAPSSLSPKLRWIRRSVAQAARPVDGRGLRRSCRRSEELPPRIVERR